MNWSKYIFIALQYIVGFFCLIKGIERSIIVVFLYPENLKILFCAFMLASGTMNVVSATVYYCKND